MPTTTSSEIGVAWWSSPTRTTVPSRMSRTIGSSASERAFQASQSPFTLRQVRLTMSLPMAPLNSAVNALDAPRIDAGEIRARDQRLGRKRAALVGAQRPGLPFRRAAVRLNEPRPRHGDRGLPERARQRSRPAAMPMAGPRSRAPCSSPASLARRP